MPPTSSALYCTPSHNGRILYWVISPFGWKCSQWGTWKPGYSTCVWLMILYKLCINIYIPDYVSPPSFPPPPLSLSLSLSSFHLFISFQSIFNDFCCSCMFITINSGSILFYLFIYCLSCLNINWVCKTFLFLYNCFTSFHLFDSLARTSC